MRSRRIHLQRESDPRSELESDDFALNTTRLNGVRALLVIVMAFGYASTMARGPESAEFGRLLGYEPSLFALQALFFLSGYLVMRSLERHGSALKMLTSRARRNLVPLTLVTIVVAFVVYPLICEDTGMGTLSVIDRAVYVLSTITCVNPGQIMPGALDTANYQCLLQGSIWTFRWGAVAYVGTAVLHRLGGLSNRRMIACAALALPSAYAVLQVALLRGMLSELGPLLAGLRLGYPFVLGMAAYVYRDSLPVSAIRKAAWIASALGLATLNYLYLPWTPFIEVAATGAVSAFALFLAGSQSWTTNWLKNWPALALPVFLLNWPVAQVLIYMMPSIESGALVAMTLALTVGAGLMITHGWSYVRSAFSPPPFNQANIPRTA